MEESCAGIFDLIPMEVLAVVLELSGALSCRLMLISHTNRALRLACMKALGRLKHCELHPSECLGARKKPELMSSSSWLPLRCQAFAETLFSACTSATVLRFCHFNSFDVTELLSTAVTCCRTIEEVYLDSSCVTEDGVLHLAKLPRLRVLKLAFCARMGSGAALLAPGFSALRKLDLSWCSALRSESLKHVGPRLEVLNLHGCDLIEDQVCRYLRNVVWLDLAFTHVGKLGALAAHAKHLRALTLAHQANNIWSCGKWTPTSLAALKAANPKAVVHFVHC